MEAHPRPSTDEAHRQGPQAASRLFILRVGDKGLHLVVRERFNEVRFDVARFPTKKKWAELRLYFGPARRMPAFVVSEPAKLHATFGQRFQQLNGRVVTRHRRHGTREAEVPKPALL